MEESEYTTWENIKNKALTDSDPLKYSQACEMLGIDPEDGLLYERGLAESLATSQDNGPGLLKQININAARIALRRFPELETRETIGVREIKKRLGEIRKTGYQIEPYSKMKKGEAWSYLNKIRSNLRHYGNRHFLEILLEIDGENREQIKEVDKFR